MCFADQATLLINKGHNTHKKGGGARKFTGGAILREKFRATKRKPKTT